MTEQTSLLFVDAYDSFTNNIISQLYNCIPDIDIQVVHIDTNVQASYGLTVKKYVRNFDAIVLGPGPGDPRDDKDIGLFREVLDTAVELEIPLLGICLGFQVLCLRYGHRIERMPMPCHGQTKPIITSETDLFEDELGAENLRMMSYNSLACPVSTFSSSRTTTRSASPASDYSSNSNISGNEDPASETELKLLAWDENSYAMAVRHSTLPLWGLQFHPESCMSMDGGKIVQKWWSLAQQSFHRTHRKTSCLVSSHNRLSIFQAFGDSRMELTNTLGKVGWNISKYRSITSQDLSSLCYQATKGSTVAMLESTARGRYCIYSFTEEDSMIAEYLDDRLVYRKGDINVSKHDLTSKEALSSIENSTRKLACKGGCPSIPFWGGWIGFLSYEMGLDLLEVKSSQERVVPDFSFVFVERSLVLDQRSGDICVQSIRPNDQAWTSDMRKRLATLNKTNTRKKTVSGTNRLSHSLTTARINLPDRSRYYDTYRACNDHLHAGNSYELCLTTESQIDVDHSGSDTSYELYQNLNKHNPVPFAAYLHFPSSTKTSPNGTTILSTSPEQFLSCSRTGTLDMMPMKGTVQRTPTITAEEVSQILQSPKETAENLMIADLICHDLYSIVGCRPYPYYEASLDPTKPPNWAVDKLRITLSSEEDTDNGRATTAIARKPLQTKGSLSIMNINSILAFDTVWQLVSHIRAHSPPTVNHEDPHSVITHNHSALHHVLPPGSMTGAPKKRSCEILKSLENRNRGVYSGIIGFMDVGGACSWSVAIRTAWSSESEDYVIDREAGCEDDFVNVEKRKVWHVGAGGAITVLSDEEGEWNEMMGKMNNVLKGFREIKEDLPKWRSGRQF